MNEETDWSMQGVQLMEFKLINLLKKKNLKPKGTKIDDRVRAIELKWRIGFERITNAIIYACKVTDS